MVLKWDLVEWGAGVVQQLRVVYIGRSGEGLCLNFVF